MPVHKSDLLYGILVYVMVASSEMRGNLWFPERTQYNKGSLIP